MESERSSSPPWPGIMLPESLSPAPRFMRDSTRSPTTPVTPHARPHASATGTSTWVDGMAQSTSQMATDPAMPPARPSHVFLGEILGTILCRPNLLPTR